MRSQVAFGPLIDRTAREFVFSNQLIDLLVFSIRKIDVVQPVWPSFVMLETCRSFLGRVQPANRVFEPHLVQRIVRTMDHRGPFCGPFPVAYGRCHVALALSRIFNPLIEITRLLVLRRINLFQGAFNLGSFLNIR